VNIGSKEPMALRREEQVSERILTDRRNRYTQQIRILVRRVVKRNKLITALFLIVNNMPFYSDPHRVIPILIDARNIILDRIPFFAAKMLIVPQNVTVIVQQRHPLIDRPYPDVSLMVRANVPYLIAADRLWIVLFVEIGRKHPRLGVESGNTASKGGDPQYIAGIDRQSKDHIRAQRIGVLRIMNVPFCGATLVVISAKAV